MLFHKQLEKSWFCFAWKENLPVFLCVGFEGGESDSAGRCCLFVDSSAATPATPAIGHCPGQREERTQIHGFQVWARGFELSTDRVCPLQEFLAEWRCDNSLTKSHIAREQWGSSTWGRMTLECQSTPFKKANPKYLPDLLRKCKKRRDSLG